MDERHLRWYAAWLSREFKMLAFEFIALLETAALRIYRSGANQSRSLAVGLLRGITRLRFAPLGMTE